MGHVVAGLIRFGEATAERATQRAARVALFGLLGLGLALGGRS